MSNPPAGAEHSSFIKRMTPDRKFKYKEPLSAEERIEAIYEEFRITPLIGEPMRPETLKDYIAAILSHLKILDVKRQLGTEATDDGVNFALACLAIASVIFVFADTSGWQRLDDFRFAIRLWGVAFAVVYIGVSIERSALFKELWKFGFTKLISSIAISGLVIFCTGKASSQINLIFGVDSSAFPFTKAFITGILAFEYLSPLLFIAFIFAIAHLLGILNYVKSKFSNEYKFVAPPWRSTAVLILTPIVLFFSWKWVNRDFSEQELPAKIYLLAHKLDFNSRHSCSNIKVGVNVVFIGSDQNKVLVDISNIQTKDIESFINSKISQSLPIPKYFFLLPCQLEVAAK